jgi:hypothetical protein
MLNKLVKLFKFEERERPGLTFSDATKIRMDPKTNRIQLRQQDIAFTTGRPTYSTDDNLYVKTRLTEPEALVQWLGFYADPNYLQQPTGTSVGYKLNDGTNDRYWDGGQWAIAAAGNWCTEAEVAANIDTFPVTRKLQVIVNLKTTDQYATPTITFLGLLMETDFDGIGSVILDSLAPSLEESMETRIPIALTVDAGGSAISLRDLETDYTIVSIGEVYNDTTDPEHLTDLYDSWDATGMVIGTAGTPFVAGESAYVIMTVRPVVEINFTSQDYYEIENVPSVQIERVRVRGHQIYGMAAVKDIANSTAVIKRRPYRLRLEVDIRLVAESTRTLFSMIEGSLKHGNDNALLRWRAVDELLPLMLTSEAEFSPRPSLREGHSSTYSLQIDNVHLWLGAEENAKLVDNFVFTFSVADIQGGVRRTGVRTQDPPYSH